MSNVKLLVLGGIALLIIVLLGNNPIENRKRAKEESLQGKDRLVESIKEHNSKRRIGGVSMSGGGGAKSILSGNRPGGLSSAPYSNGRRQPPGPVSRTPGTTQYPSYMMRQGAAPKTQQNPFAAPSSSTFPNSGQRQQQPAAQNEEQPQGYYPPPPVPKGNPSQEYFMGPGSNLQLRSGQKLYFAGSKVFTVNAEGKPVPLPDGSYPVADGRINMIVRDGHKIGVIK